MGLGAGRRMVLLAHSAAPKGDHFDWMIQDGDEPESPLRTWRVMVRLDQLVAGDWFIAEQLAEHRAAYLTYEGPVSGGRGKVERVSAGQVRLLNEADHEHLLAMWDGGIRQRMRGWRIDDLAWRFVVERV